MNVAYIPQDDKMFSALTCREAIIFSSKAQNCPQRRSGEEASFPNVSNDHFRTSYKDRIRKYQDASGDEHVAIANRILEQTGLTVVADTRIGSCSGGQQKRISLAMALVAQPSILVVDEPTSGLDSTAAENIIELLFEVSKGKSGLSENCIVFVTIHQPNWNIFNIFDKIYMFTRTSGKILYEGKPGTVPQFLHQFNADYSKFSNPADVLMEVACGCYSDEIVQNMIAYQEETHAQWLEREKKSDHDFWNDPPLSGLTKTPKYPFFYLFYLVFMRAVTLNMRNPWMLLLRIGASLVTPILFYIVFDDAGTASGCPPPNMLTEDENMYDPPLDFFKRWQAEDEYSQLRASDGSSLVFMLSMMGMFLGIMPVLMTIPGDLPSVIKEVYNTWYTVPIYFLARLLSEIPFTILSQTLYIVPIYFIVQLPDGSDDIWRLFVLLGVNYVYAIGAISHGLFVTSFFLDHAAAGIYVGTVSLVPFLIACGQFIPYREMNMVAFYSTYLSYHRYVVETSVLAIFGWDRCGVDEQQRLTDARDTFYAWAWKVKSTMVGRWETVLGLNSTSLPPSINSNMGTVGELTEVFSQVYLKKYFTRSGKPSSLTIIDADLDEDDIGPDLLCLFIVSILYLAVPYALLSKRVHRRE